MSDEEWRRELREALDGRPSVRRLETLGRLAGALAEVAAAGSVFRVHLERPTYYRRLLGVSDERRREHLREILAATELDQVLVEPRRRIEVTFRTPFYNHVDMIGEFDRLEIAPGAREFVGVLRWLDRSSLWEAARASLRWTDEVALELLRRRLATLEAETIRVRGERGGASAIFQVVVRPEVGVIVPAPPREVWARPRGIFRAQVFPIAGESAIRPEDDTRPFVWDGTRWDRFVHTDPRREGAIYQGALGE